MVGERISQSGLERVEWLFPLRGRWLWIALGSGIPGVSALVVVAAWKIAEGAWKVPALVETLILGGLVLWSMLLPGILLFLIGVENDGHEG